MNESFDVPILLIVFRRVETTRAVLNEIRKLKPKQLFIASDGPRDGVIGEDEKVKKVRELFKDIDWDCEVKTLFREKNGIHNLSISSAVSWFFDQVPEGIVLEDDCLPHPSFFRYCEELLQKYRNDKSVMMICGANFQQGNKRGNNSYYSAKIGSSWGFASWQRAWQHYDITMSSFPEFKQEGQIKNIFDNKKIQEYWLDIFEKVHNGTVKAYDYPWIYAIWANGGLVLSPNVNLISNIGFGKDALTYADEKNKFARIPTQDIGIITHPKFILGNKDSDEFFMKEYLLLTFFQKVKNKLTTFSNKWLGHKKK